MVAFRRRLHVSLNKPRSEVDVELDQGLVAHRAEAVNLAGLHHQDVARGRFVVLPIHRPLRPPGLNEGGLARSKLHRIVSPLSGGAS